MSLTQSLEFCRRVEVELQHKNRAIVVQVFFKTPVRFDLLRQRPRTREVREPAAHLFLEIDDGGGRFIRCDE